MTKQTVRAVCGRRFCTAASLYRMVVLQVSNADKFVAERLKALGLAAHPSSDGSRLGAEPKGAREWLADVIRTNPGLFAHWPLLYAGQPDTGGRMRRAG